MTPLSAASARPEPPTTPTALTTSPATAFSATASPVRPAEPARLTNAEWAGRYDAIDLFAARLHNNACAADATGSGRCSDTHWMAWTGPALAVLAGAHMHIHHHAGGRRLVIEIDFSDPSDDAEPSDPRAVA